MVDVLLEALAVVARGQSAASGFGEQAGLDALGLSVVSDFLDDDAPFAVDVHSADWASIKNVARANVSFTADPVALIEGFAIVERVVKVVLVQSSYTVNQVVGQLVGNFGVFLQD